MNQPAEPTVVDRVLRAAREHPDRPAVVDSTGTWTYAELTERARQLAWALRDRGVRAGSLVGVGLPRGRTCVAANLAVWAAGGAYVPLDPTYPAQRLEYLVADSGVEVVLTTSGAARFGGRGLDVEGGVEGGAVDGGGVWPDRGSSPADLAYVIYTSGSTGEPKGVMVEHASLANLVDWHGDTFGITVADRCSHIAAAGFDASVWEIWSALAFGACLHVAPEDVRASFDEIVQWCRESCITVAFLPTAVAEHFLRYEDGGGTGLRLLLTGGDTLRARPAGQRYAVVNNYGPTECTVVATSATVSPATPADQGPPSIGRPIANTQVYVIGEDGLPVPPGTAGELWICGAGVARGYLNRPVLTHDRFVDGPGGRRAYRTGDLVSADPDGSLRFLGRIDDQVKVRGHRVEPGEVDAVVRRHPDVTGGVTVARAGADGERHLVTYVVCPAERFAAPAIRARLAAVLPPHMLPAALVRLDALPMTAHGKVDRDALPAAPLGPDGDQPPAPPGGTDADAAEPLEAELVSMWAQALGNRRVGRDSDFFDFGGHSLQLTGLLARIRERFGVALRYRDILDAATPALLAAALRERAPATAGPVGGGLVRRYRAGEPAPLSAVQQQLWLQGLLAGDSAVHNVPVRFDVRGTVDVPALAAAVTVVVRRQEVLRARFTVVDGLPVQTVGPPVEVPVEVLPGASDVDGVVRSVVRTPFDLAQAPPLRVVWVTGPGGRDGALLFVFHHIAVDAWSVGLFVTEVNRWYAPRVGDGSTAVPDLPAGYVDYALWQRDWVASAEVTRHRHDHVADLAGYPMVLDLPFDRPRPAVRSFAGDSVEFRVPAPVVAGLERVARDSGATLFMVLLSAFLVVLGRWSGQTGMLVGLPTANRTRVETEPLIGFFVNTLVLPGDVSGNPAFDELVRRVRDRCLAALTRQDVPFESIVDDLAPRRSLSYDPVVQVMFVLQNAPAAQLAVPGVAPAPREAGTGTSQFDLTMELTPDGDALRGSVPYATDLFDRETVDRFAGHLLTLLGAVVADPYRRIGDLPMLGPAELAAVTCLGRGPVVDPGQQTVGQRVQAVAAAEPYGPAVADATGEWTYHELVVRAGQVANTLRATGVRAGSLVGVCLPAGREMVAALLGVWAAGGAYVPLDPAYPSARLRHMAGRAALDALLTTSTTTRQVRFPAGPAVVELDRPLPADESDWPGPPPGPHDLAYVIYTSGSTGEPKGVMVEHHSLTNLITSFARDPGFTIRDRMLALTSLSFDIAGLELFLPLCTAGFLAIAAPHTGADADALDEQLRRYHITHAQATPATWHLYAGRVSAAAPELRQIWCGGEELTPQLATDLLRLGVEVYNVYGPTETTIWSSRARVVEANTTSRVPLGGPIANTDLYVLDPAGRHTGIGIAGELCIAGAGVARGYLRQPGLTAERFTAGPDGTRVYRTGDRARWRADGQLHYHGRLDHQTKIRGHRIEPGEVDAATRAHPAVRDAVTVAFAAPGQDSRLVTYLTARGLAAPTTVEVREFLAERLPAHLVPSAVVVLDRFPLTPNGKVDRAALPDPGAAARPPGEPPRTPTEIALAGMWQEVLGGAPVSRDDEFFALGGNSLSAARVLARIRDGLGGRISLTDVFARPTLRGLARRVDELAASRSAVPVPAAGAVDREAHRQLGTVHAD